MTTSATHDFLSELRSGRRIPASKLAYFEARLSGLVHQAMLKVFGRLEHEKKMSRRQLAQRIGKKPEQITRWFSYPSNLTLETVSDIFVGQGYEVRALVLSDLVTGETMRIPEQPISQVAHMGALDRLLRPASDSVHAPVSVPAADEGGSSGIGSAAAHGDAISVLMRAPEGRAASDQGRMASERWMRGSARGALQTLGGQLQ